MFTIKLRKCHVTKIVEAKEIAIYPAGTPEPVPVPQGAEPRSLPTNKIREISIVTKDGEQRAFYVSEDPRPDSFVPETEFYDVAYIENSNGATTETVRAY